MAYYRPGRSFGINPQQLKPLVAAMFAGYQVWQKPTFSQPQTGYTPTLQGNLQATIDVGEAVLQNAKIASFAVLADSILDLFA